MMGPGSRYASASRIVANNVIVFPPVRRIKQQSRMVSEQAAVAKWVVQFEAACHRVHFHHLQDHKVAMEARPRRLKVRILAPKTE